MTVNKTTQAKSCCCQQGEKEREKWTLCAAVQLLVFFLIFSLVSDISGFFHLVPDCPPRSPSPSPLSFSSENSEICPDDKQRNKAKSDEVQ